MGLSQLLTAPDLKQEQRELHSQFYEATGYSSYDVLSVSYLNRIFLTRNGGEYRVEEDGSVTHLAGPAAAVEDRLEL